MSDTESKTENVLKSLPIIKRRHLKSKVKRRNPNKLHQPKEEVARHGPTAGLQKARQNLLLAEEKLKAKRSEYEATTKLFDRQWEKIRRQQNQLRNSFIRFDRLVSENALKSERAERKIVDQQIKQVQLQKEVKTLEINLKSLKDVKLKIENYLKSYDMYHAFLYRVRNETDEFQSVNDIFNKYESLIHTKGELFKNEQDTLELLENKMNEKTRKSEGRMQIFLKMNSQLTEFRSRAHKSKEEELKWELMVSRIKDIISAKEEEVNRTLSCIWNVYKEMCKRKGAAVEISQGEVEQQLNYIKHTILQLKIITQIATKQNH